MTTNNTFSPTFTTTNTITQALTQIERARGFLEAATLSEDWIKSMGERALVLEAHYTTHIEGTHLTLSQAEMLLAGQSVPEADPDDTRELLNYKKAFEFVSGYLESGAPVTEGLIREIHKHLVEGVRGGKAAPGEYRKIQNYVVNSLTGETIYTPPPAHDVPIMMGEMVQFINNPVDIHPVLVSGIAQFHLVHIHPFLDGNGRTSRLLSTLCLYRAGYDFKRLFTISEYYDRDRPAFYKAIQSVRNNNMDMTTWLEYFIEGLSIQLSEVAERGKNVMRADLISQHHDLNDRQNKALRFILHKKKLDIKNMQILCPNVNRRTLQRDLQKLETLGLITLRGAARQSYYVFNESKK